MKYRRKPVVVDAERFDCYEKNMEQLQEYCNGLGVRIDGPSNLIGMVFFYLRSSFGEQSVNQGDWIVTDADGKRFVCSNRDFEAFYEKMEDDQ